ncbi:MAG: hypothetical protein AAF557_25665 [Pseudomonadota bacterium]
MIEFQDFETHRVNGHADVNLFVRIGTIVQQIFEPLARDVRGEIIPRAGHWLGDENPTRLANVLSEFFFADTASAKERQI